MSKHSTKRKLSILQNPHKKPKPDAVPSESDPDTIDTLLNSYSKEQLIDLISDAVSRNNKNYDNSLYNLIYSASDDNPAHRKLFVYGLSWDSVEEDVVRKFEEFGEIEECNVVVDKQTRMSKGFGFVLFRRRESAVRALAVRQMRVKGRTVSCQLAVLGFDGTVKKEDEVGERKIYVKNVRKGADGMKLKKFFEKFGEIESGPTGMDKVTGQSRGYAVFLFKTVEGAKKVLEEPYKWFEGKQMYCEYATVGGKKKDGKGKELQEVGSVNVLDVSGGMHDLGIQNLGLLGQQQLGSVSALGALAGMQSSRLLGKQQLGLLDQQTGLSPYLGGFLVNQTGGLIGQLNPNVGLLGQVSPLVASGLALNPHMIPVSQIGTDGMMRYGVGAQGLAGLSGYNPALGGVPAPQLHGLQHLNPSVQIGQMQIGYNRAQGAGRSFSDSGYPGSRVR